MEAISRRVITQHRRPNLNQQRQTGAIRIIASIPQTVVIVMEIIMAAITGQTVQ